MASWQDRENDLEDRRHVFEEGAFIHTPATPTEQGKSPSEQVLPTIKTTSPYFPAKQKKATAIQLSIFDIAKANPEISEQE